MQNVMYAIAGLSCSAPAQHCSIVSKEVHAQHAEERKAEDKEYNHCEQRKICRVIPSHTPQNTLEGNLQQQSIYVSVLNIFKSALPQIGNGHVQSDIQSSNKDLTFKKSTVCD